MTGDTAPSPLRTQADLKRFNDAIKVCRVTMSAMQAAARVAVAEGKSNPKTPRLVRGTPEFDAAVREELEKPETVALKEAFGKMVAASVELEQVAIRLIDEPKAPGEVAAHYIIRIRTTNVQDAMRAKGLTLVPW